MASFFFFATPMHRVDVHLLPELAELEELRGSTCVVIDVLRATTTIAWALAAGAESVLPCLDVDQARELASHQSPRALLGGERGGVRIEGFDLGNSPSEYTASRVAGRAIVFTTTNGTKAMQRAGQAQRVLLGAFTHLSPLTDQLRPAENVQILCAGTKVKITREDVLLAGAIVDRLIHSAERTLNDSARIAQSAWQEFTSRVTSPDQLSKALATELRDTQGGRNLIRLGLEADLGDAASTDRFDFVPVLDVQSWRITKP